MPSPRPELSVLIPVYNEIGTVATCIERVEAAPVDKEILVIDDGSRDGTSEVLQELQTEGRIRLLIHANNRGKGAALRTGIPECQGRITIIQDADLEYDPGDYPALIAPFSRPEVQVVYGSRRRRGGNQYPMDLFLLGSLALTFTANLLYGARLTDEPTGYKVFRTSLLQSIPLRCERFEFCPEVTAKIRRRGIGIVEVPIRYHRRTVEEGKKIGWRDGLEGLWTLLRYWDGPRSIFGRRWR